MITLTPAERKALLILFKDFTIYYNANSLSKTLKISHVGAQKLLKRLLKDSILTSKKIGKSIIYRINTENEFSLKLISFLLANESNDYKRWLEEFKELNNTSNIVLIYGSAIKNYEKANDIDIMIILKKENINKINRIITEKENILPKKLHAIKLTTDDLLSNINNKNKVIIEIIKNAIVLYNQDKFVEMIKNVTSF